jgi:DNA invertase Pin-like site-specific DNA recombinase
MIENDIFIDKETCCLHRCDNPSCVNPNHLFTGSQLDNIRDTISKGRNRGGSSPGEKNKAAKLTEAEVREIRMLYNSFDISSKELSERYGVSLSCICRIVGNKSWKSLDPDYKPAIKKVVSELKEKQIKEALNSNCFTGLELQKLFHISYETLKKIKNNKYRDL